MSSSSVTTQPNNGTLADLFRSGANQRTCGQKLVDGAAMTTTNAITGGITAAIFSFSTFTPLVGAAFGAVYTLTFVIADGVIDVATQNSPEIGTCIRIAAIIPIYIASIVAGLFVTASLGFPVTFFTGFLFSIAMIVGGLAFAAIKFGLACCSHCISGATQTVAGSRA